MIILLLKRLVINWGKENDVIDFHATTRQINDDTQERRDLEWSDESAQRGVTSTLYLNDDTTLLMQQLRNEHLQRKYHVKGATYCYY
jgi:hypothetical protein